MRYSQRIASYRNRCREWLELPLSVRREIVAIQLAANRAKEAVREAYRIGQNKDNLSRTSEKPAR